MNEQYGRTDMLGCGCAVDADGFIATECAAHRDFEMPEDKDDPPVPGGPPMREGVNPRTGIAWNE